MPIKRPVPGKVVVDSETLQVLDDRIPADEEEEVAPSYEMDFHPNTRSLSSRQQKQDFYSRPSNPPLDIGIETGYTGGSQLGQQHSLQSSVQVPAPLKPQSTGNAFRDQMEQNRRMRAGQSESSPEGDQAENGSEDEDDIALRKPLHSGRLDA